MTLALVVCLIKNNKMTVWIFILDMFGWTVVLITERRNSLLEDIRVFMVPLPSVCQSVSLSVTHSLLTIKGGEWRLNFSPKEPLESGCFRDLISGGKAFQRPAAANRTVDRT